MKLYFPPPHIHFLFVFILPAISTKKSSSKNFAIFALSYLSIYLEHPIPNFRFLQVIGSVQKLLSMCLLPYSIYQGLEKEIRLLTIPSTEIITSDNMQNYRQNT